MTTAANQANSGLSLQVVNPNQPTDLQQQATMQNFQDIQSSINASIPQLLFSYITSTEQNVGSTITTLTGFQAVITSNGGVVGIDAAVYWSAGAAAAGAAVYLVIDGTTALGNQTYLNSAVARQGVIPIVWRGILGQGQHMVTLQVQGISATIAFNNNGATNVSSSSMFIVQY
jgi:hypothetical protein